MSGNTTARNLDVTNPWASANASSDVGVWVETDNYAFMVGNIVNGWADSGNNEASGGDGLDGGDGGLINTGMALFGSDTTTTVNSNETTLLVDLGGATKAENIGIDSSYVEANADSLAGVMVVNENGAIGGNLVFVEANSGWNEANGGDGDTGGNGGYIDTGDAGVLVGSDVSMNDNYTLVAGDFGGNTTAENLFVDSSYAEANTSGGTFIEVINLNDVYAVNSVEAYANTGWNTANGGSDGGEIYTGEAFLVTDVGTTVNSSTTVVAGAGGGNATASNTAVSNSYAEANASSTGSTGVINTNSASVETSVSTAANTGENDASGSSSGGIISTGSAVNETSVSTTVNTNDTTVAVEQGNARASNTGVTDSSATATAESSTTTTVTNTNDATVVNNVSTSSNTGGNTATDGGSVSTGGAGTGVSGSTSTNTNTVNLVVGP